jgi:hypothetical protein
MCIEIETLHGVITVEEGWGRDVNKEYAELELVARVGALGKREASELNT